MIHKNAKMTIFDWITTPYGNFTVYRSNLDKNIFRLRWDSLRRHEDFREYCKSSEIKREAYIFKTSYDDPELWAELRELGHLQRCIRIYGNIFDMTFKEAYSYFWNVFRNYQLNNVNPFQELKPGTPAPRGRLSISINPWVHRKDIIRVFEKFITMKRKFLALDSNTDPLLGYFNVTEKRFNISKIERYLTVHNLNTKYPLAWKNKAKKQFPDAYTGLPSTVQRKIYRDLESAKNIISWVVRGRFPCTKPFK